MKWVYLAGGAVILAAAIVALIGAMLPRAHHATRQARYRQKPEAIYFTLAGPVDWRSDIKASGNLPDRDGRKQWWEQDSHGHKITYELVEDKMPSRRVTRIAEKKPAVRRNVDHRYFAGGGRQHRAGNGRRRNLQSIFRFMARFFFGYTATIEGFLRDLASGLGTDEHRALTMGQELECRMQYQRRTLEGRAYLEGDHILFRGDGAAQDRVEGSAIGKRAGRRAAPGFRRRTSLVRTGGGRRKSGRTRSCILRRAPSSSASSRV